MSRKRLIFAVTGLLLACGFVIYGIIALLDNDIPTAMYSTAALATMAIVWHFTGKENKDQ